MEIFKGRTHFSSFDMVAVWIVKRVNLVSNFLISERRRCGFDFLPLRLGGAPLWLELASMSRGTVYANMTNISINNNDNLSCTSYST